MVSTSRAGAGVRSTPQRAAIIALLDDVDGFRSAQELHDELRRRGQTIGLTTVYRTLQTLAAADLVDTVRTDTGATARFVPIRGAGHAIGGKDLVTAVAEMVAFFETHLAAP